MPRFTALLALLACVACGAPAKQEEPATPHTEAAKTENPHGHPHGHHAAPPSPTTANADPLDQKLDEVARIHGAPGPWAVLGYRMSEYALENRVR